MLRKKVVISLLIFVLLFSGGWILNEMQPQNKRLIQANRPDPMQIVPLSTGTTLNNNQNNYEHEHRYFRPREYVKFRTIIQEEIYK